MFAMSLHRGATVVDKLLDRFGVNRLGMVEQLSPNSYRGTCPAARSPWRWSARTGISASRSRR